MSFRSLQKRCSEKPIEPCALSFLRVGLTPDTLAVALSDLFPPRSRSFLSLGCIYKQYGYGKGFFCGIPKLQHYFLFLSFPLKSLKRKETLFPTVSHVVSQPEYRDTVMQQKMPLG